MRLFDTHCHLTDDRFSEDREKVIARMREAGVEWAVNVADGARAEIDADFELAARNDFIKLAAGVHPQDALKWDGACESRLRGYLADTRVVALGEIGLDYHWDDPPRDAQRPVFDAQLDMAYELRLPAILHIRDAHGDATDMLTARFRAGRLPLCVLHCYSGSWESAKTYLNMGMYISFTGSVTFKNAPKLREVAKNMPLNRLMVETDCPYMAPVPLRGSRNEPAYVAYTAAAIAQTRDMPPEELATAALQNGKRFFQIP